MEDHNIPYFRNLWQENVLHLENQCKVWEEICCDNVIPDDVLGEIRTAIGLARLLMNQKLKQFEGLINDSEFHTGEKEITCSDLEGFWDMVYFEVEKIHKSFDRLDKCKSNDWKFVEHSKMPTKKKLPLKKDNTAISKKKELVKAQMLAARQGLAEAKKKMIADRKVGNDQNLIEILQPSKEGQSQISNSADDGRVINTSALTNKTMNKEFNENKKDGLNILKNEILPSEANNCAKESAVINDSSKQKSPQRKKHSSFVRNKENIKSNDSSGAVHISAKQTKSREYEEKKRPKDFVKLQCVTRSAAKKAMLLQQNTLQKP